MPLLSIQLVYNNTTNVRSPVVLTGSLPKQPISLRHYQVKLASQDGTVDGLYVSLPFLNNYDVNTNFTVSNAIPLFHEPSKASSHTFCDLEFNPARNIDEVFSDWQVYDEDGEIYTTKSYVITLLFNYRRPELI